MSRGRKTPFQLSVPPATEQDPGLSLSRLQFEHILQTFIHAHFLARMPYSFFKTPLLLSYHFLQEAHLCSASQSPAALKIYITHLLLNSPNS